MNEIWKDVVGYEGLYKVSNLGNVYSFKRNRLLSPYVPAPGFNLKYHARVTLYKNGEKRIIFVHRLVADAFIPNPNSCTIVNHKDGNKMNNCVDNFEWCTQKENVDHYYAVIRPKQTAI